MRRFMVMVSLGALVLGACGTGTSRKTVNACTLVDSSLARSLVGDPTGERDIIKDIDEYAYDGCRWERADESASLTVDAKVFRKAPEAAEEDYRSLAEVWGCTTPLATSEDDAAVCAYEDTFDTGVIFRKGPVVARIGYKGKGTPQHDRARRPEIAKALAARALSAL